MQRSRVAEAATFLGEVRQRQEAYRSEFGMYCDVGGGSAASGWNPASTREECRDARVDRAEAPWQQLGARPDGAVRFQYTTWSGIPGTTPAGINRVPSHYGRFLVRRQARSDLNGDGTPMTSEAVSWSNVVLKFGIRHWIGRSRIQLTRFVSRRDGERHDPSASPSFDPHRVDCRDRVFFWRGAPRRKLRNASRVGGSERVGTPAA